MTCRDCIEEGTATGGPCAEPRHQGHVAELTAVLSDVSTQALLATMYEMAASAAARTQERDRARRWAVALEQECARLADQVRVLSAVNATLCDIPGAVVADLTDTALAAARAEEQQ